MSGLLPALATLDDPVLYPMLRRAFQFQQFGVGAVLRPFQDKMRDIVSVKDFGAKGDGVTADSAKIQAAIDSVLAKGGGAIYFPAGTYIIDATLQVPLGARYMFFGDGPRSILMAGGNIGKIVNVAPDPDYTFQETPQDVVITGLAYQMDVAAAYDIIAISADKRHQLIVDKCFFGRFIGTALPDTVTGDRYTKYARMNAIVGDELNNSNITNNLFVQINRGVQITTDCDDVIIANNVASYCNGSFARINTGHKAIIHGNTIEETFSENAISLANVNNSLCIGNTVSESYTASGILLNASSNNIINSNNCYNNQIGRGGKVPEAFAAGIRLVNSSYNVITDNVSGGTGIQFRGISIEDAGCTGNLVSTNNLRGNTVTALNNAGTATVTGTNIT